MKCLDCEKTFKAETSDEMLKIMHPHYMSDHKDITEKGTEEDKKEHEEKLRDFQTHCEAVTQNIDARIEQIHDFSKEKSYQEYVQMVKNVYVLLNS